VSSRIAGLFAKGIADTGRGGDTRAVSARRSVSDTVAKVCR
jgi:hypothetical protein